MLLARAEPLWIAVGYQGRRLISHDGREWRDLPVTTKATLRAVVSDGARFVAAGGATLSTRDGEHWVEWPGAAGEIETLACGRGRLVAVRGGHLLTATTEERWVEGAALPYAGEVHARQSACGDTEAGFRYAVLGEMETPAGPVAWRGVTEDGQRWDSTARDTPPARALVHGAGIFVAAGPGSLLETSHDGELWTRRALAVPDDLETLLWTGTQFIAQGKHLHTSSDGFLWRVEPEPPPGRLLWARAPGSVFALSWSQMLLSGDLKAWAPLRLPAGPALTALTARGEP